jgi:hypothetical protein
MKIKPIVKGLGTFIPGLKKVLPQKGYGRTAYYCYGVWLKHLTLLWESGMNFIPQTLAELGPGDSLGVGLAAMLCGVNNYFALDVIKHSNIEINLKVLDELVALFKSRAPRPTKGWPDFDMYLDSRLFPSHILTDRLLEETLSEKRISLIRNEIKNQGNHNHEINIKYQVPWLSKNIIKRETVDIILSHVVLEHVSDLENTYQALYTWLKPQGVMSHQIDFSSHSLSEKWNGHRAFSELLWKIIMGKRPFLINRQPYSIHKNLLTKHGFEVNTDLTMHRCDGIQRADLSKYWKDISDEDLTTASAFIIASKSEGK